MSDSLRPLDCSPPGFSVHVIFQTRILKWVAISSSRGYSQPKDQTCVSCIAGSDVPWNPILLHPIPITEYYNSLHTYISQLDCAFMVDSVLYHPDLLSMKDILLLLLGSWSADSLQLSPCLGSISVTESGLVQGCVHSHGSLYSN